ncbi:MAG: sigma-70 family RNA polymerase sigma factor [Oscillospiraceae bacterium]|jgi:RNA polymerase sigma-70 factor (ECF subfamily)|nr:sigma-70 family RNA polymerase sigma factor [Oscillospiraceae bacterium]
MPDADFQALVDACYAKVFYHSLKAVKNGHDAADIAQNTFLKAFLGFGAVRNRASLEPWLFAVCNNEIRRFFRSSPKDNELRDVAQARQAGENHDALYAAIDRLPEAQRLVVLLKYFGGYSMRELATALGLSLSTVKSRLYEARQALKKSLLCMPPTLPKERRTFLMSMLNLCAVGAKTIPCMSLRAQKQLLQCAKDNAKFGEPVLAELADIPSGREFLAACSGSLSYDELVRVLACCDEALLYRMAGQEFKTWRSASGSALLRDVAALYGTGGYVDSVEMILYVPSMLETVRWYKRVLNWDCGESDEELEQWGHATVFPYSSESARQMDKTFKGFHLREDREGGKLQGCGCFVFVSGLEDLRAQIIGNGWEKIGEIRHNGWGTRNFDLTDLNGFDLEFCEWECG